MHDTTRREMHYIAPDLDSRARGLDSGLTFELPMLMTDPNADLIGYTILGVGTVTGSAPSSNQLVYVAHPVRPAVTSVRAADQVRRHKEAWRVSQADSPLRAGEAGDLSVHPAA